MQIGNTLIEDIGFNARTSYSANLNANLHPLCSAGAGGHGDPHMFGGHGGRYDFRGKDKMWYNLLSTANLSVAVLFQNDVFGWRYKTVDGSFMTAIAITAGTTAGRNVTAIYYANAPSKIDVTDGPVSHWGVGEDQPLVLHNVSMQLSAAHLFSLSNGQWLVEAKSRLYPYRKAKLNLKKKRLDISIRPLVSLDSQPVAPHGLIGQTFDGDSKMVMGKLDNYNVKGNFIRTEAMGEGAIEGIAADYEVAEPFATAFKFSRFGAAHAPPRNASLLTGVVAPALDIHGGKAGAVNDVADEDKM